MSIKKELKDFLQELKHNSSIENSERIDIDYVIYKIQDMLLDDIDHTFTTNQFSTIWVILSSCINEYESKIENYKGLMKEFEYSEEYTNKCKGLITWHEGEIKEIREILNIIDNRNREL